MLVSKFECPSDFLASSSSVKTMASPNPMTQNSEASLFSISATPTITSHKLNAKNYLAWSASVEFWSLSQGHYDHLEKSLDEISEEKRDQWKKLDYQLCALLWQSVDSDILPNFKAFKTCHSFWKKAQSVFAYDSKRVFDSAQKLVTLKQCDSNMVSYVSKAQSVVEELKLYFKSDTLEEMKYKLDNLFTVLVLHGMHSDYKHVCDEILTSQELPSLEKLFIRLLQVHSQTTGGNSTSFNESYALGQGNCRGQGDGKGCRERSLRKRMRITEDTSYSHHSFPENEERLNKEKKEIEYKKKETEEAHPYTIIKVARDDDFVEQIGKEIFFDLVDHNLVRSFHAQKTMPFNIFQVKVAKVFGVPIEFQRFWIWTKRQNHTYRPYRPLTPLERAQSVGKLSEPSDYFHNVTELNLFLEVELGLDLRPIAPLDKTKDDILLFFKLFDNDTEELRYAGRLFVKNTGMPTEILKKLNEMAGYDPDQEIRLYEEIRVEPTVMCEPIDENVTFSANQLQDGDIICFQKAPAKKDVLYTDVPSYLEVLYHGF